MRRFHWTCSSDRCFPSVRQTANCLESSPLVRRHPPPNPASAVQSSAPIRPPPFPQKPGLPLLQSASALDTIPRRGLYTSHISHLSPAPQRGGTMSLDRVPGQFFSALVDQTNGRRGPSCFCVANPRGQSVSTLTELGHKRRAAPRRWCTRKGCNAALHNAQPMSAARACKLLENQAGKGDAVRETR